MGTRGGSRLSTGLLPTPARLVLPRSPGTGPVRGHGADAWTRARSRAVREPSSCRPWSDLPSRAPAARQGTHQCHHSVAQNQNCSPAPQLPSDTHLTGNKSFTSQRAERYTLKGSPTAIPQSGWGMRPQKLNVAVSAANPTPHPAAARGDKVQACKKKHITGDEHKCS